MVGGSLRMFQDMLGEGKPISFIFLVVTLFLLYHFSKAWLRFFDGATLWRRKGYAQGLFIPQPVKGTAYPYGIVELRGRRPYMEDRHTVVPYLKNDSSFCLYGVFDGHGGPAAAQFCTDYLGVFLNDALSGVHSNPRVRLVDVLLESRNSKDALKLAFKKTDAQFLELARIRELDDGTTALCVLTHGENNLTIANAGDSRAVVIKREGGVLPLSFDHKPDRSDERERISNLGGSVVHWGVWRVEGVLAVSRAIGDRLLKEYVISDPDVIRWVCTSDDAFVVLATDGLWDVLSNMEVATLLTNCSHPQKAAETLAKEAFSRGSTDNITVLVIDVRARE